MNVGFTTQLEDNPLKRKAVMAIVATVLSIALGLVIAPIIYKNTSKPLPVTNFDDDKFIRDLYYKSLAGKTKQPDTKPDEAWHNGLKITIKAIKSLLEEITKNTVFLVSSYTNIDEKLDRLYKKIDKTPSIKLPHITKPLSAAQIDGIISKHVAKLQRSEAKCWDQMKQVVTSVVDENKLDKPYVPAKKSSQKAPNKTKYRSREKYKPSEVEDLGNASHDPDDMEEEDWEPNEDELEGEDDYEDDD